MEIILNRNRRHRRLVYRKDGEIERINLSDIQGGIIKEELSKLAKIRNEWRCATGKMYSSYELTKFRSDDIKQILKDIFGVIADDDKVAVLVSYTGRIA